MRIAKSALIDPERNEIYGMTAVALSFFVFAYSSRFGQISVLAYYGMWLPLVVVDYRRVLGNYPRYLWIFGFGILTVLSSFWSEAVSVTMRASIQYMTHIVCALIAMRVISIRTLTRGALIGIGVVLLYSLLFGIYLFDALDGTYSFVGAFSSKNQLGFYASLGVIFAASSVLVLKQRGIWLPIAGVTGLLSAYSLIASQSATSAITTAAVVALIIGFIPIGMLSPANRKMMFFALGGLGTLLAVASLQFGLLDAILGIFGKDSTLTGRTYLWQQGIEAAKQAPILGVGYQGFWVAGFADAERLWNDFFITGRSGFHFHNTYIETVVENGFVGMILLGMVLYGTLLGHLRSVLMRRSDPQGVILFAICALFVVRSFVEIDIIFPYQIGSFLLYFAAGKLCLPVKAARNGETHPAIGMRLQTRP
ncbi:O-antigen ligase family protein [Agrobacterium pusense]|uniref:O-antigen ligase family protein n=1 Tax=Agrobacterium pusense TaxID=648995 RepID=UPI0010BE8E65|nr:O-antigen ligase [Agrobacterium pusense]MDH0116199.1 O-antigen ligase family protein [Agrobacterium pusense]QCL87117.1 O-antigen ligase family protein [Agrobacterium pusense]